MKFSVITPSYNQVDFIEKTILSVLNQPYQHIEYIIIDGGSTDGSVDIIKKYSEKITYWCSERDNGQSNALNKGFLKATGEVLCWINSDDYFEANVFPMLADLFSNKDVNIVNGNCMMHFAGGSESWIDKSGIVNTERMLYFWKDHFCPPQPAIFFRKSVLDNVGMLNENLNYGMDLDLWLRMSLQYKFTYVDKTLAHYLIHSNSKSGSEGGFSKFIPEWKRICLSYLDKVSFKTKLKFNWLYFLKHRFNRISFFVLSVLKYKLGLIRN